MKTHAKNKNLNPIFVINRQNILEESYSSFKKYSFNLSRPLNIRFANENIEDEGGLYHAWYQEMFKELIFPNKKLFLVNPYKSLEPYNIIIYPKYPGQSKVIHG